MMLKYSIMFYKDLVLVISISPLIIIIKMMKNVLCIIIKIILIWVNLSLLKIIS